MLRSRWRPLKRRLKSAKSVKCVAVLAVFSVQQKTHIVPCPLVNVSAYRTRLAFVNQNRKRVRENTGQCVDAMERLIRMRALPRALASASLH